MLAAAADTNHGVGQVRREAQLPGAIDDLGGAVTVDECFGDDEARTKCAHSIIRGDGHSGHIPFISGSFGESGLPPANSHRQVVVTRKKRTLKVVSSRFLNTHLSDADSLSQPSKKGHVRLKCTYTFDFLTIDGFHLKS